jgi:MFS family permease
MGADTSTDIARTTEELPSNGSRLGPRYWRFWRASTISAFGDNLRAASLPLLAATLTRNPTVISLVAVTGFLPWLLFGPAGGIIGDRGNQAATMRLANLIRFGLTLAFVTLVVIGYRSIAAICVLTATLTILQIVYSSAATGYLTRVVPKRQLALGNSRLESGRSLAGQFLGAPVGALLFSVAHWLPLAIDSATFAVAVAVLPRAGVTAQAAATQSTRYLQALRESWTFMRRDRSIRAIAMLLAAVNFVSVGVSAIMVLFVLETLHAPSVTYGLLTACLALGAFAGTFTTGPLLRRIGPGYLILASVAGRVACLTLIGFAPDPWVAGAALIVQGITMTSWNVVSTTTVQTRAPSAMVGRVGTLVKTVAIGAAPLGAIAAGLIAGSLGLRAPFLIGAAIVAIAGCITVPPLLRDTGEKITT